MPAFRQIFTTVTVTGSFSAVNPVDAATPTRPILSKAHTIGAGTELTQVLQNRFRVVEGRYNAKQVFARGRSDSGTTSSDDGRRSTTGSPTPTPLSTDISEHAEKSRKKDSLQTTEHSGAMKLNKYGHTDNCWTSRPTRQWDTPHTTFQKSLDESRIGRSKSKKSIQKSSERQEPQGESEKEVESQKPQEESEEKRSEDLTTSTDIREQTATDAKKSRTRNKTLHKAGTRTRTSPEVHENGIFERLVAVIGKSNKRLEKNLDVAADKLAETRARNTWSKLSKNLLLNHEEEVKESAKKEKKNGSLDATSISTPMKLKPRGHPQPGNSRTMSSRPSGQWKNTNRTMSFQESLNALTGEPKPKKSIHVSKPKTQEISDVYQSGYNSSWYKEMEDLKNRSLRRSSSAPNLSSLMSEVDTLNENVDPKVTEEAAPSLEPLPEKDHSSKKATSNAIRTKYTGDLANLRPNSDSQFGREIAAKKTTTASKKWQHLVALINTQAREAPLIGAGIARQKKQVHEVSFGAGIEAQNREREADTLNDPQRESETEVAKNTTSLPPAPVKRSLDSKPMKLKNRGHYGNGRKSSKVSAPYVSFHKSLEEISKK